MPHVSTVRMNKAKARRCELQPLFCVWKTLHNRRGVVVVVVVGVIIFNSLTLQSNWLSADFVHTVVAHVISVY